MTILNPINLKNFDVDKLSVLDIKAVDSSDRRYKIEVQTTRPFGLPKRLTYYAAKLLTDQLKEGDQYADLNPSICICLLGAMMFREEPSLQHAFQLRTTGGLSLTDCLQVHVFELPKYVIPTHHRPITDPVDQWLHFSRTASQSTPEELARRLPDPVFQEATGVLEMIARNPQERQFDEDRLKAERDEWARTEQAKLEGIEQGIQQRIEQGIQQGKRTERSRMVQVLRDIIGDVTPSDKELAGLSLDEVTAIETDLQRRLRERA